MCPVSRDGVTYFYVSSSICVWLYCTHCYELSINCLSIYTGGWFSTLIPVEGRNRSSISSNRGGGRGSGRGGQASPMGIFCEQVSICDIC